MNKLTTEKELFYYKKSTKRGFLIKEGFIVEDFNEKIKIDSIFDYIK